MSDTSNESRSRASRSLLAFVGMLLILALLAAVIWLLMDDGTADRLAYIRHP